MPYPYSPTVFGYSLLSLETNVEEVQERFRIAEMRATGEYMSGMFVGQPIARIVEKNIRQEAPQGCTGELKAGISAQVSSRYGAAAMRVEVFSQQFYTDWVINGRGWVYPIHAKALHWKTCDGEDVFAMYSRPSKPNPFHERGWQRSVPEIRARWHSFGGQIAEALAD